MKLALPKNETLVRIACVLALIALPMMTWSLFDPTVWPVLIALSVGQGVGALSFALYLFVVARDLRIRRRLRAKSGEIIESSPSLAPPSSRG